MTLTLRSPLLRCPDVKMETKGEEMINRGIKAGMCNSKRTDNQNKKNLT